MDTPCLGNPGLACDFRAKPKKAIGLDVHKGPPFAVIFSPSFKPFLSTLIPSSVFPSPTPTALIGP